MDSKTCSRCRVVKPLSDFYPRNDRGRYESKCKVCQLARHKDWAERNKSRLRPIPASKHCWCCKRTKPGVEFGRCISASDGRNPACLECAREYANTIGNKRRKHLDPTGRTANIWSHYRIRPDQYRSMLDAQQHRCKMCGSAFRSTPHIDHCHNSGRVRGLLCNTCNSGLGFIERAGFLDMAMTYLKSGTEI